MRLPFLMTPGDTETPPDFASRLSWRCRRDDLGDFCRDFGLDVQGLVDGNAADIALLATLAGVGEDRLAKEAFVRVGKGRCFVHKGEVFRRDNLVRGQVRACAACLCADVELHDFRLEARPHRRSSWIVDALRTCPLHGTALFRPAVGLGTGAWADASGVLSAVLPRLGRFVDDARHRRPSPFETYVAGRLRGDRASPWLDALPMHAALHLADVVGAVAARGPKVVLDDRDDDATWADEAVGFEILGDGEAGLRRFLDRCLVKFADGRTAWGPKSIFGRLYEWLAHETDDEAYEPVRRLMTEHVGSRLPVGVDHSMFGRTFEVRRFHSVHSLARQFDVHPKRLRKLLIADGVVSMLGSSRTDDRLLVDAARGTSLVSTLSRTLSLKEAAEYLNLPRPFDARLVAAGYLRPVVHGGKREPISRHGFERTELDRFLAALTLHVDPDLRPEPGLCDIRRAAARACSNVVRIVGLLLDGRLRRVAVDPEERGFLSILVDVTEVKNLVVGPDHGGVTLRDAERRLRTTTLVVTKLIEEGFLKTERIRNPLTKAPQTIVRAEDLERFEAEFVTLTNLAAERGVHFRRLGQQIAEAGIEPVRDPGKLHVTLYRRSTLP